jgi:hypothetical protein
MEQGVGLSVSSPGDFGGFVEPLPAGTERTAEGVVSRFDRRRDDEQLLRQLRSAGFDGAVAEAVSDELIRYGWAVLDALMYSGAVFAHIQVLGRGVTCPDWLRDRASGEQGGP